MTSTEELDDEDEDEADRPLPFPLLLWGPLTPVVTGADFLAIF